MQSVQTDLGLTYGGTPLAAAANTSTTVLTLTGSLATVPVPILAKSTITLAVGSGAQFSIYYDGGTTPAMVGVTPTAGVPIALTGAGTGLLIAWAAGSSVTNDTWQATCAGLADQSGNAKDYSQAGATQQPVLTVGLLGKPGLLFDGANDVLNSALALVAPGTTPHYFWAVFRQITWTASDHLIGDAGVAGLQVFQRTASPTMAANNGAAAADIAAPALLTWTDCELQDTNSAGDTTKIGTTTIVHNNGNSAGTGVLMAGHNGAQFGNVEVLAMGFCTTLPNWAAFRAAVTSFYGGSVVL